MNKRLGLLILLIELLVGIGLRLYKIDNPIADWHEFRQADTASVSRYYLKNGINLLYPRYGDLSNIQSGKDNPNGYRFVEFPIYNALHAVVARLSGLSIEKSGRLLSVFFSVAGLIGLWVLGRLIWDDLTALLVVGFSAVNAYWVYYSRVVLPEPLMIAAGVWALVVLFKYVEDGGWPRVVFGGFLLATAILIKPFILVWFLGIPILVFIKKKWSRGIVLSVATLLALMPFGLWRWWMLHFPEGIPAYDWLFNGDGIRFRPAFFRWIFYERIVKLILGGWGVAGLVIGLAKKVKDKDWVILGMLGGAVLYLFVIATGNVRHDYYQILLFPPLALFVGRGLKELVGGLWTSRIAGLLIAIIVFVGSTAFGWYEVKGYYQINHPEIVEAGREADRLLPPTAKVIAPYFGDTAFLYYTNRPGWPLGYGVEDKIKKGATAYVSVNFDQETKELMGKYKIIEEEPKFVIIDLTNPVGKKD